MSVSQNDPRPPYRQIADDLRASVQNGTLAPGQRVPAVRELARTYGVASQTISRAVDLLKVEGVLVSHPPRGVFVASPPTADDDTPPSTEFQTLMGELDDLQQEFRRQLGSFDERLRKIEDTIRADRSSSE